jgi:FKBP-type peptidyl-prolyl cis-trans isomerase
MKVKLIGLAVSVVFLMTGCNLNSDVTSGQEQLINDLKVIDTYLASKGINALKDVNGIRFTIDSLGAGYPPRYTSRVTFDYTGKLFSGSTFQSGTVTDKPITDFITGFQIGLPSLPNGTKATFYIPSVFAYGSQAQNNIPANSNLIFQIKLKGITTTSTERTQLGADTVKIDQYLASANVANVVKDSSGLRYVINQAGTGAKPTWFSRVKIVYTGYLIENGSKGAKFYVGSNEPSANSDSRVVNFIRGFQIGLQQMQKGSKATFYIPSGLAFGTSAPTGGLVTVPQNANLIYEVELLDILAP